MTTLKRNAFAEHSIKLGIPLLVIAAAAQAIGLEVGSWQCIVMGALAATMQTVFAYFVLEPHRARFEANGAMGSYYNYWAAASTLATLAAIGMVYGLTR